MLPRTLHIQTHTSDYSNQLELVMELSGIISKILIFINYKSGDKLFCREQALVNIHVL